MDRSDSENLSHPSSEPPWEEGSREEPRQDLAGDDDWDADDVPRRPWGQYFLLALLGACLTGGSTYYWQRIIPAQQADAELEQARGLLTKEKFADAERLALHAAQLNPRDPRVWIVAGEAAIRDGRPAAAIPTYQQAIQASQSNPEAGRIAHRGLAEAHFQAGHWTESERLLRERMAAPPPDPLAIVQLSRLLNLTGRRWESIPHLLEQIRYGKADLQDLLLCADEERLVDQQSWLKAWARLHPDDPLIQMGLARLEEAADKPAAALPRLKQIVAQNPDLTEAQSRLGGILLQLEPESWEAWHRALPKAAEEHPQIWVVRGQRAERGRADSAAARCYWEALRRDSEHRLANERLRQCLIRLNRPADAEPFGQRSDQLQHLAGLLNDISQRPLEKPAYQQVAMLLYALGRSVEAYGWAGYGMQSESDAEWPHLLMETLQNQGTGPKSPRTLEHKQPALQIDLSGLPLPDWSRLEPLLPVSAPAAS